MFQANLDAKKGSSKTAHAKPSTSDDSIVH